MSSTCRSLLMLRFAVAPRSTEYFPLSYLLMPRRPCHSMPQIWHPSPARTFASSVHMM